MSRARRPLGSWPAAVRLRAMRWCPAGRDTMLQLAAAAGCCCSSAGRQLLQEGGRRCWLAAWLGWLLAACCWRLLATTSYSVHACTRSRLVDSAY
jgi:hypothetical protein